MWERETERAKEREFSSFFWFPFNPFYSRLAFLSLSGNIYDVKKMSFPFLVSFPFFALSGICMCCFVFFSCSVWIRALTFSSLLTNFIVVLIARPFVASLRKLESADCAFIALVGDAESCVLTSSHILDPRELFYKGFGSVFGFSSVALLEWFYAILGFGAFLQCPHAGHFALRAILPVGRITSISAF